MSFHLTEASYVQYSLTIPYTTILYAIENLCAKASSKDLNVVMSVVVKITNTIIGRSALNHRKFKTF